MSYKPVRWLYFYVIVPLYTDRTLPLLKLPPTTRISVDDSIAAEVKDLGDGKSLIWIHAFVKGEYIYTSFLSSPPSLLSDPPMARRLPARTAAAG